MQMLEQDLSSGKVKEVPVQFCLHVLCFQSVLRLIWWSTCTFQRTVLLSKPVIPVLCSMRRTQNADEYGNAYAYGGQRDDALRMRPKINRAVLSSISSIDLQVSVLT